MNDPNNDPSNGPGNGPDSHQEPSATPKDNPAPRREGPEWERELLTRLAFASLAEQRRTRRWNMAFRFGLLLYLVVVLVLFMPTDYGLETGSGKHTALVDLQGVISDSSDASADRIATGLRAAFEDDNTAGVILRINSPGGSPVQSSYISDEMQRLRSEYPQVPLYAVISDIAASGGYFVATGADRIYANRSSIVGSIGVLMNGFGFVDGIEKLGIERRLLTAGRHKGLLDPFSPVDEQEMDHMRGLLKEVHGHFIDVVRQGRGDKLAADDTLFSGLVWSGEQGMALGLVDDLGSTGYVAREIIGVEDIVDFTPGKSYVDLLSESIGVAIGRAAVSALGVDGPRLR